MNITQTGPAPKANLAAENRSRKFNPSMLGRKHSKETKLKMRLVKLGRTLSAETKIKIRLARLGTKATPEAKRNMSIAAKRRFEDPVQREKYQNQNHPAWKGGMTMHTDGYILVRLPNHPESVNGYVREHHLVWERHNGRPVPPGHVVHHKDGNRTNNNIENLQLMMTGEHIGLENKRRCPR
jgi:hypothetical protein